MDFPVKLGKRIKELRKSAALSQDKAAEQAGISGKYLGEIERGEVNVSVAILANLASVLQTDLSDLLSFGHHATRKELQTKIFNQVTNATDDEIRLIYRILNSVLK